MAKVILTLNQKQWQLIRFIMSSSQNHELIEEQVEPYEEDGCTDEPMDKSYLVEFEAMQEYFPDWDGRPEMPMPFNQKHDYSEIKPKNYET